MGESRVSTVLSKTAYMEVLVNLKIPAALNIGPLPPSTFGGLSLLCITLKPSAE